MKIVCDSCGTKYSISDDKVRGKVFKIRCKKCSHIIVVRGTNEAASASAPAAAPEGGWHLVVDGDQVGPVPESDIRGRIERGEINAETYVWKEGLADWLKLSVVPEFAQLVATPEGGGVFADGSGSGSVNGDAAAHQPAAAARGGGLFGGAPAGGDAADVFGGLAPAQSRGADLFASPAAAARPAAADESRWPAQGASPAAHDGGRVESLTGQRHENSVLFSLSNLQSLAMPAAASRPLSTTAATTEGSGLIDIRAMAATTLGASSHSGPSFGSSGVDDLPAFGAFSPAAPVLLALPNNSGPPKWIYAVIGVAVVLVIAIGVMAYKILNTKPITAAETVAAPAAPVAAAPGQPSAPVAAAAPAAPSTIPDEKLPPREAPKGEAKSDSKSDSKSDKAGHHKSGKGDKPAKDSAKKGAPSEDGKKSGGAAAAVTAVEPTEKKPAKGSLDDLLDGALNGRKSGGGGGAKPRVEDDSPRKSEAAGSGPLAKGAVVAGMNSVKGKISDCYGQFKVSGMAMVTVIIGKSGHVSSATVTGKFAGTPTGACVEKAVKSASFPPSDGLTTPYPFQLK
jgi:predicted Zn finger-like uncharacterized protein